MARDLTLREAAQALGITLGHAYSLVWSGRLEAARRDGRWYIARHAVKTRLGRQRKVRT